MSAPPEPIDLSLYEVEAAARAAACGAGLPFGVAEEVGRSAVWLARHVGAWADGLLALLEAPPPDAQSPLLLGCALADGAVATAEWVVAPLWVVPVALAGPGRRNPVAFRLGAIELRCNPGEVLGATMPADSLAAVAPGPVVLRLSAVRLAPLAHAVPARFARSVVTGAVWRRLTAFGRRDQVR